MDHHVHQPGVGAAGSLIAFSVNLSGITGNVPRVIDRKTGFIEKTDCKSKDEKRRNQELP
jgi:hypothetical protein